MAAPQLAAAPKRSSTGATKRGATRRRGLEQDLALLAAIVESSDDAIVSRGLDGLIRSWNAAAERMFGWPAQEAIGRSIGIIVPPDRRGELRPLIERVVAGENLGAVESAHLCKDGARILTSVTFSAMKNASGEVVSVSLIYRDITKRKRAEEMQARLSAIVEQSDDAIISRGLDRKILTWNPAAERLFGWKADEAIGQSISLIVPPDRLGENADHRNRVHEGLAVPAYDTERLTKYGQRIDVSLSQSPVKNERGDVISVSLIFRDVTERRHAQEHIAFLSQYDTLTGLPNRSLFRDRLELALARARRRDERVGIMLFNLDRFRQVNEGLGLEAGDDLLRQVAERLKDILRGVDTIARLGGDEFAILVEGVAATGDVIAVAEKITLAFATPFRVRGSEIVAAASIGVTMYPNGAEGSQMLLEHAEIAMRRVKSEGGGYRLYEADPAARRGLRFDLETRLRHALERGEINIHYQPKVSLATGTIVGAEALVRWTNPELGAISPAQLIPIAEESGLIVPIGEWVLQAACSQAKAWQEQGLPLQVAVNLSPRQFRQKNLLERVSAVLADSGLAPERLELEITESTAMANPEQAIAMLGDLRRLGVRLAVDDFGTGYSSLNYLKRFPLHRLKIDRAFVKDIGTDSHDEAIIHATVVLAHSMKLCVTAEGVETLTQRDFLARAGCDEYQGFLFSRPLPAEQLYALLRSPSG